MRALSLSLCNALYMSGMEGDPARSSEHRPNPLDPMLRHSLDKRGSKRGRALAQGATTAASTGLTQLMGAQTLEWDEAGAVPAPRRARSGHINYMPGRELLTVQLNRRRGKSLGLAFSGKYGPVDESARIVEVVPDSPADCAGIRPLDRIVKINGAPVNGNEISGRVAGLTVITMVLERPASTEHETIRASLREIRDEEEQDSSSEDGEGDDGDAATDTAAKPDLMTRASSVGAAVTCIAAPKVPDVSLVTKNKGAIQRARRASTVRGSVSVAAPTAGASGLAGNPMPTSETAAPIGRRYSRRATKPDLMTRASSVGAAVTCVAAPKAPAAALVTKNKGAIQRARRASTVRGSVKMAGEAL